MRRSEDVQVVFWTSDIRSIYLLCVWRNSETWICFLLLDMSQTWDIWSYHSTFDIISHHFNERFHESFRLNDFDFSFRKINVGSTFQATLPDISTFFYYSNILHENFFIITILKSRCIHNIHPQDFWKVSWLRK